MMSPIGPVRDCSRVPRPGATDDGARAAQARPGVGSLSSDVTGSVRARRARRLVCRGLAPGRARDRTVSYRWPVVSYT